MCKACDHDEAQEFRQQEINRIKGLSSHREQLLAAARSDRHVGGEEKRRHPWSDTGHPTFMDLREAGLSLPADRAYQGVLHLIRHSTPKTLPPTHYVALHLQVQGFGTAYKRFKIGHFSGSMFDIATSDSDYPQTHTYVLRSDGALLRPPVMGAGFRVTTTPDLEFLRPDQFPKVYSIDAKDMVKRATTEVARFSAKPSTTDELEIVNAHFERAALSGLLSWYERNYP